MPYETTEPWDMPLLNWEPEGSYESPISPPLLGPTGGTLVCIPPINKDWVKIILGCLDQLRIPATWKAVDRADLLQALNWMQELKDVVASAGPCCDVQIRLTAGCVLQFSTDSGATWSDVTDWSTNFCNCVNSCVIPPVPPFPPDQPVNQHACNIAGFIASEIINKVVDTSVTAFNDHLLAVEFGGQVMASIGWAFPITYLAYTAFEDYYVYITSMTIADFTAAQTDPALWSAVTCAIYSAIRTTGYITSGNLSSVIANVCALSYTYPEVISAICAFLTNVGIQNLQKMQTAGALDDVDCSGCAVNWCHWFDFTASNGGWANYPGASSVYAPGIGWQSTNIGGNVAALEIYVDMLVATNITQMDVYYHSETGQTGGRPHYAGQQNALGVANVCAQNFTIGIINPGYGWISASPGCAARYALCAFDTAFAPASQVTTIAGIQLHGTGVNPFGPDNCIH
jgi:hypothetical protein